MMAMRYLYAHHRNVASLSPSSWLVLYANFIFSFSALSKQAMKLIRDYDDRSLIMCLLIAYYSCLLLLISPRRKYKNLMKVDFTIPIKPNRLLNDFNKL